MTPVRLSVLVLTLVVPLGCDQDDDSTGGSDATEVPTSSDGDGDPSDGGCLPPPPCGEPCPTSGQCCPCLDVPPTCTTTADGRPGMLQCQMYGEAAVLAGGSCLEVEPCDEGLACIPSDTGLASCEEP